MPTEIHWRAIYKDGTTLLQTREDGEENRYLDIDRTRLAAFELLKGNRPVLTVHLEPGQRLIYRRRVFMRGGEESPVVFYLVGWQKTVGGENVQSISVLAEDSGAVHMIGRWHDNHPVFASIEPIDGEEIQCES